jgi:FKBP-type peptidyl-prolyl cis-trans isomerase FklB
MKVLSKYFLMMPMALMLALSLASCSENDDTVEEYPDWKNTNTAYFNNLYTTAKTAMESGDTSWKIFRKWSASASAESQAYNPEDCIVVKVLENGTGSGCPLYNDNVWVHYQGRLLPSTSYADGYVFDQSFYGTFNENTAVATQLAVSGTVDGFATALQEMHIGDHWQVYIPYQLGYGESSSDTTIPAYSLLIFDIRLVSYARTDADVS